MKAVTARAKEQLAVVEKKVHKQLSRELKAKTQVGNAERELSEAKQDSLPKGEDERDAEEASLATHGKPHSRSTSSRKPKRHHQTEEVEGEDARQYVDYVDHK